MLSKEVSSTIFKVFGMTPPGIEHGSPGLLANTLPTRPMSQFREREREREREKREREREREGESTLKNVPTLQEIKNQ